jgi:hypothetical protein
VCNRILQPRLKNGMQIVGGIKLNLKSYRDQWVPALSLKEQMEAWYKPMTSREDLANWFADRFDQRLFEVLTKKESHDRPKRTD